MLARHEGDFARGQALYGECLPTLRRAENRHALADVLQSLGRIACYEGRHEDAKPLLSESLDCASAIGDHQYVAFGLEATALLAASEGQALSASRLWGAAERLRERTGTPLPPITRVCYDRDVAAARETAVPEAWAAAWAEGRETAWADALDLAQQHLRIV